MGNYPSKEKEELITAVLKAGVWRFGELTSAAGKPMNNWFDMPLALKNEHARQLLIPALSRLALRGRPDAVWGVPRGGQIFAEEVAEDLGLPVIALKAFRIDGGPKQFRFLRRENEELAREATDLVGVEDVVNEGGSVWSALQTPLIREKTKRIVACMIRGDLQHPFDIPVNGVIEELVPNEISSKHPFYSKYGRYGC